MQCIPARTSHDDPAVPDGCPEVRCRERPAEGGGAAVGPVAAVLLTPLLAVDKTPSRPGSQRACGFERVWAGGEDWVPVELMVAPKVCRSTLAAQGSVKGQEEELGTAGSRVM